jgi:hypothetical protein
MNDLPENELFSAYLDGELTAAQQAEVEQLLAQNAAARQLMDELRALSATLQSLPAHRLPEDLSQQVLRVVERRAQGLGIRDSRLERDGPAATSGSEPPIPNPQAPRPNPPPPATLHPSRLRQILKPRNLRWPAIAVAAAIMIMVMNADRLPPGKGDRDGPRVAMAPKDASLAEESTIGPAVGAENDASRRFREEVLREEPAGVEEKKIDRLGEAVRVVVGAPAAAPAAIMAKPSETAPVSPPAGPPPLVAKAMDAPGVGFGMKAPGEPGAEAPAQDFMAVKQGKESAGLVAKSAETVGKKADGPLVVLCAVTPEAMRSGAFERIAKLGEAGLARKAKGDAQQAKEGEDRILDVELTQAQLTGVLVSLRNEPQFFPFIIENPTPADVPVAKGEGFAPAATPGFLTNEGQQIAGKSTAAGQADAGTQPMKSFRTDLGQANQQAAPSQSSANAQPGLQQKATTAQSAYGSTPLQSQVPGGLGSRAGAGGFGGRGDGTGGGMGGTGFGGMNQPGPEADAPQTSPRMSANRGSPPAESSGAAGVQQRSSADASQKGQSALAQPAPTQPERLDSARPDVDRQSQPGGSRVAGPVGGTRTARAAAAPAPEVRMSRQKAGPLRLQARVPAPVEAPRSQALAQRQDQVEAKLRVLFVLQVVPDASSTETIAKRDLSAKAEQSKAVAAPAKPAPGKQ